jgi:hypothetical protein
MASLANQIASRDQSFRFVCGWRVILSEGEAIAAFFHWITETLSDRRPI